MAAANDSLRQGALLQMIIILFSHYGEEGETAYIVQKLGTRLGNFAGETDNQ